MNLQTAKPEEVLANSKARVFLILFISPDAKMYWWGGRNFELIDNDFDGAYDLEGVMRELAAKEYYKASTAAQDLPFPGGKLDLLELPNFLLD